MEDRKRVVVVTVAQGDHGLEGGDVVVLEDMRGGMEGLNGKAVAVRRVAIASPVSACPCYHAAYLTDRPASSKPCFHPHCTRILRRAPDGRQGGHRGVAFRTAIALPTPSVISNFEWQYDFNKSAFDGDPENSGKKFPVRNITVFNRLALVLDDEGGRRLLEDPGIGSIDAFGGYQSGGC